MRRGGRRPRRSICKAVSYQSRDGCIDVGPAWFFWGERKGREQGIKYLQSSKEKESKRCRRRSGGRVFEKRIQTPKGALISPPLAPARRSRSSLRTRAGWTPSRRRCPVARWTSRLSLLFSFSFSPQSVSFDSLSLSPENRGLSLTPRAPSVCCGCCCCCYLTRIGKLQAQEERRRMP